MGVVEMSAEANPLDLMMGRRRMGREEIMVSDEVSRSVMVLEFAFRSEDITVWFGGRALAVMHRAHFVHWLWNGGSLMVDDLLWTVEPGATFLTIDGNRTYLIDSEAVTRLAEIA